jgi:hypothetical protein
MKSRIYLFFCFVFLNFCIVKAQNPAIDTLKMWMEFLSSDEMKGRANGSVENIRIADWIAQKFLDYGVHPLPNKQWLMQDYPFPESWTGYLSNVVGYVPGKLNDPYIILSAHYDHIGLRPVKGQDNVYNGADDDASGIVLLLAIAKKIHESGIMPECPIVFIAFSGEEIGLLGSSYFCESKSIPWDKIKMNLNFELVGRSMEFGRQKYYITGPDYSNLSGVLAKFNIMEKWQMINIGPKADQLFRMADNYSFIQKGKNSKRCIAAHTLATTVGENYVHQVYDESKNIDYENLTSLVDYTTKLVYYLSCNEVVINCNSNK